MAKRSFGTSASEFSERDLVAFFIGALRDVHDRLLGVISPEEDPGSTRIAERLKDRAWALHESGLDALDISDLEFVERLLAFLTTKSNPPFRERIAALDHIAREVFDKHNKEPRHFGFAQAITELKHELDNTHDAINTISLGVNTDPHSPASAAALLLMTVMRSETWEYALSAQLEHLHDAFGLPDEETRARLLSTGPPVLAGTKWRSHSRALRDSIGHARFRVELRDGTSVVLIKNHSKGYAFECTLTADDLSRFHDEQYVLYTLMLLTLQLHELRAAIAALLHERLDGRSRK